MSDFATSLAALKDASRALALVPDVTIKAVLHKLADALEDDSDGIIQENAKDLAQMKPDDPMVDRLLLDAARISGIARDVRTVAALPSPVGNTLLERTLPNGLKLSKVTVPLGVVGIIYEARPNVTVDAFALCFASRNACALKGGSVAEHSNKKLVACIQNVLREAGLSENILCLLPSDRTAVQALLHAQGLVDVVIPRGSQELISFVREEATVPVIETGAGIVHIYVDQSADIAKAAAILSNAKTRRPSVCNAVDTLLLHADQLANLKTITAPLAAKNVQIFADERAFAALQHSYPKKLLSHATAEHFGTEFLSLKLSIKTVDDVEAALQHIAQYSSGHSEAIIAEDSKIQELFLQRVDSAAVYANASTAFTDGGEFGIGAEIGISTQKLHARGPMGLQELTSYKWIVRGDGQIRT